MGPQSLSVSHLHRAPAAAPRSEVMPASPPAPCPPHPHQPDSLHPWSGQHTLAYPHFLPTPTTSSKMSLREQPPGVGTKLPGGREWGTVKENSRS